LEKQSTRPLVVITGAAGDIGSALAEALSASCEVVGLDQPGKRAAFPLIEADLSQSASVDKAFAKLREGFGARIASVVHLAAYFDFTGEDNPLYRKVNVEGTRLLLKGLQSFEVEQFIYSSTMLVHQAGKPGQRIDESWPLAPKWAYPRSKADAEAVIRQEHGRISCTILRLAGLYDETSAVPTLAHQIARIYERDLKSHLYSGDPNAGQAMVHREDMLDAFKRAIERRHQLEAGLAILIGETDAPGYDELQDRIGRLIHGEREWTTLILPQTAAKAGAWMQERLEPVIPDALDQGEKPFIRPFMISMASDHYALDTKLAKQVLGWQPRHRLIDELPKMVRALKEDPPGWYETNGITMPSWMEASKQHAADPEEIRVASEAQFGEAHRRNLWTHFVNIGLGTWLITSPPLLGIASPVLAASDITSGALLVLFASLALSWRLAWSRWVCAAIGLWVMCAPILFWAADATAYLNGTLVGALIMGLAVAFPPEPGVSRLAATRGPETPPGWTYNPSAWTQRIPIIALAFVGLYVSRYLAAYQLGYVDEVWEPFFAGSPDPRNGTEEIITSSVSQAWPVADAAVGALTYILEIITGAVGSRRRWRTMPWLVLLFGLMIVPLGVVSIFFIIIQPIWIGTWCTLCLIGAAAMMIQIPYSLDELVATGQFLARRRRAGQSLLRVFLFGDTDEPDRGRAKRPEFDRPPITILDDMIRGGVSLPWNIAICALIGIWLMFTRLTLGSTGSVANSDHLIGSLVLTVCAITCAEVARPVRYLNVGFGVALLCTPFLYDASETQTVASVICGLALTALSVRRGQVKERYGGWVHAVR
jgi:nucleoside-diphosphate-sugar epimerase